MPGKGECGISQTPSKTYQETEVTLGEFPFTAALGYTELNSFKQFCGGTLINKWFIITAAHCRTKYLTRVRLGEHRFGSNPDCNEDGQCLPKVQDFDISSVIVHENYEPSDLSNDIALVKLSRAAVLNNGVQIVCLPIDTKVAESDLRVSNLNKGLVGKKLRAVAWDGTKSSTLQKVDLPVMSLSECTERWNGNFRPRVSQICAGGNGTCLVSIVFNNISLTINTAGKWKWRWTTLLCIQE